MVHNEIDQKDAATDAGGTVLNVKLEGMLAKWSIKIIKNRGSKMYSLSVATQTSTFGDLIAEEDLLELAQLMVAAVK